MPSFGGCLDPGPSTGTANPELARRMALNPFAVGHRINHPPRGVPASVDVVDFEWGSVFESAKQDRVTAVVPNVLPHGAIWYVDPEGGEVHRVGSGNKLCGMALVSLRPIDDGEELYLDYDLPLRSRGHPAIPEWYHPATKR